MKKIKACVLILSICAITFSATPVFAAYNSSLTISDDS